MTKPKAYVTADQTLIGKAETTMRETVARILATFDRATASDIEAGATWYGADATAVVAAVSEAGCLSAECAAVVIAHLSPRTSWARNVAGAMAAAEGYQGHGVMSGNYGRAYAAIASYRRGGNPLATFGPNAHKTHAFARNLLGDRTAVTVDVWALRVALGPDADESVLKRAGVYAAVSEAYRVAARARGVDPTTMQATTWVVARNGRAG